MSKNITKKPKMEKEAQEHILLGKLLQKQRSPEKKKEVEKVLKSNLNLKQKIGKIKQIDSRVILQTPGKPLSRQTLNQPVGKTEDHGIARNRKKIKKNQKEVGFFQYLLHHSRRIKIFGVKTHIFSSGFLPFTFKLNSEIKLYFRDYFQKKYIPTLLYILNHVVKTGWKTLSKKDYNLVIMLKKLCDILMGINFFALNFKDKNLIDRLHNLEVHYFYFHYKIEYVETIIHSIKTVLENDEKFQKEYKDVGVSVKRLLFKDITLPSLHNFILGLNMFKYRRYLTMADLINLNIGNIITAQYYDCTDLIQENINEYIYDIEKSLSPIVNRRNAIKKLKGFLPSMNNNEPDYSLLEYFYNDKTFDPPYLFTRDRINIVYFSINFGRRFTFLFQELLNGHIELEETGRVEIFSNRFFSIELFRINQIFEKLEKLSFSHPKMTEERYRSLKVSIRNAIAIEIEIFQLIGEGISTIVEIGQKLSDVILKRNPASQTDTMTLTNITLDPVILAGKHYTIPYEIRSICSDSLLQGRTVLDALTFVSCICFLTGVFFKEKTIDDLLKNEEKINRAINDKVNILRRVADTETFQKITSRYKI